MSFMDDKKEVLTIELTQYGRQLLAKGEFKPEYYSFFDEDVVYDSTFAGFSETQSESTERILQHSIITKPLRIVDEKYINQTNIFENTLATSETSNLFKPSWETQVSNALISSITNNINAGQKTIINLEDVNIKYHRSDLGETKNMEIMSSIISDGEQEYFYSIEDPSLLIELYENNADNIKNNFELELFSIDGNDNLERYNFIKKANNIKDNILYDFNVEGTEDLQEYADRSSVESYFIVEVDNEIVEVQNNRETSTSTYSQRINNGEDC
jgi:hypothetical protein